MSLMYNGPSPEILIVGGRRSEMHAFPGVPVDHPEIIESDLREQILFRISKPGIGSCTRGYQATWEIHAGKLYLKHIRGMFRLRSERRLFAWWFCGDLPVPIRLASRYVAAGYEAISDGCLLLPFDEGLLQPPDKAGDYGIPDWEPAMYRYGDLDNFDFLRELVKIMRSSRASRRRK